MSLPSDRRKLAYGGVAVTVLALSWATVTPSSAAGQVLWTPSTDKGASSFAAVQCASGNFKVVNDAAKGKVWRAHQAAGQERCETLSPDLKNGDTFYLGWSSKVDIKDANSRYVFQLKCDPSTDTANHPIEIDATNGRIRLQEWDTKHVSHTLWTAPTANGQWHSYALKIRLGRTDGTIDFWFDGKKQTFTTGSGTFKGTTWDGNRNYLKWGSYHESTGDATNTFTSPVMATTLEAATAGS
ncbi:polysaccharide lyase-like protein [Streptomyces sp. 1114.5]|uniref:heparin lyase I family protein n=1 Tax=unclassified Streptomyces TaxID=2593676 RepID=UPI000BD3C747|nr:MULTISPECIES: heparin lyase I family protein [unclassified Streptomyces]RKT20207.1 polysaccharide lyase-like protein [Streptomyces sp. 1114.5]SOB78682.1 Polysaccharide lyase [Streptomyces sp. 1331.2]